MKIYSEKTEKEYATVEECLAAEKEFDEKKAAEEKALVERKEKARATRKADAEKVEEAHKKMVAASRLWRWIRPVRRFILAIYRRTILKLKTRNIKE